MQVTPEAQMDSLKPPEWGDHEQAISLRTGTMRSAGSIYHDAYTGLEELEEQQAVMNQLSGQLAPIQGQGSESAKLISQLSHSGVDSPKSMSTEYQKGQPQKRNEKGIMAPAQTSAAGNQMNAHPPALEKDPNYDVMKNLPVMKEGKKKVPAEPLQSESCCKCTIF